VGVTPSSDTSGTCSRVHSGKCTLLGDTRFHVMANVHEIHFWIRLMVLLDAARVGSHAHRPQLWWTNLVPKEVLRQAYETIP
jgi:hypothetical protein